MFLSPLCYSSITKWLGRRRLIVASKKISALPCLCQENHKSDPTVSWRESYLDTDQIRGALYPNIS